MQWVLKVVAFKVLGLLPGGNITHRFMQETITQSLRVTEDRVLQKIQVGMEYLDYIEEVLDGKDLSAITHVDIGAGWMPTIPLLFYSVGLERQLLLDVRRNMHAKIVRDVIYAFRQLVSQHRNLKARCRRLPPLMEPGDTVEAYLRRIGLHYIAPYDCGDLLNEKGFKFVTCTQVLLHLNKDQLRSLFKVISSALKDGGLFLAPIHLYDVYSDFDKSLSPYNKWRYSDFVWDKMINSTLMSFNRLTASEYRQVLEESGLEIMKFHVAEPTLSDLQKLRRIKVHKQFSHVPETELAAKYLFFAAKRPDADVDLPRLS
jgi:hypothetical protein